MGGVRAPPELSKPSKSMIAKPPGLVLVPPRPSRPPKPTISDPLKNHPSATLTKRNGNREWRIHAGKEMYLLFFGVLCFT